MGIVWETGAWKKGLSVLDGTERHVSSADYGGDVLDSPQKLPSGAMVLFTEAQKGVRRLAGCMGPHSW